MSISTALNNALSGLTVSSRQTEVISDNVANALTPGYSRKEVEVSSRVTGGQGNGAYVSAITAAQDPALTAERRRADASASEAEVESETADRITNALGDPGENTALANRANEFETALAAAAADPASTQKQSDLVFAAENLSTSLNQISTENRRIRMDADAEIAKQVDEVNDALQEIQRLNQEISIRNMSGRDASGLVDQRDALIDEVNSIIPIQTHQRSNGEVALYSQNGQILLDGTAATLEFNQTGLITADMTIQSGALSGLAVNGRSVTIGQGNGTGALDGGSLSALFETRDVTVPEYDTQLDALAADLIARFEDPAVDPTLTAGDAGLFTDNGAAYDPANETGLASRISVNAAVDPDQGGELWRVRDGINATAPGTVGDATILEAGLEAATEQVTPSAALGILQPMSFSGFASELTSQQANTAQQAEERSVNLTAQLDGLVEAESASTGVDTDRELEQLLLVEQVYAANARVITVADEMIQRLLEI